MAIRYRAQRRWFREPLMVLQVEETRNHIDDLGGSGYYDEYQTKRWRDATVQDVVDIFQRG